MKIEFKPFLPVSRCELEQRRKALTQKYPPPPKAKVNHLAVVGGGPSVLDNLEIIRSFDAVWAINNAWRWLKDNCVRSTGFTLDSFFFDTAPTTIFGDGCDPEQVKACPNPYVAPLKDIVRGTTTATAAPLLAIECGYKYVSFFGCEGSFRGEQTHAFKNLNGTRLLVSCNGSEYITNPQMFMQCEVLALFMRAAPHVFIDRSGGLLSAMIADDNWDMKAGTPDIHRAIMESGNGNQQL